METAARANAEIAIIKDIIPTTISVSICLCKHFFIQVLLNTYLENVYISKYSIPHFFCSLYGEIFLKKGIDTDGNLCYSHRNCIHLSLGRKVHISEKKGTFDNVEIL